MGLCLHVIQTVSVHVLVAFSQVITDTRDVLDCSRLPVVVALLQRAQSLLNRDVLLVVSAAAATGDDLLMRQFDRCLLAL